MFFRGPDDRLNQFTAIDGVWARCRCPSTRSHDQHRPGSNLHARGHVDVLAGCAGGLCRWTSINGVWTYKGALPGADVSSAPALSTPREDWIVGAVRNQGGGITRWEYAGSGDWFATTLSVPSDPGQAVALVPWPTQEFVYAHGTDNELKVRTLSW